MRTTLSVDDDLLVIIKEMAVEEGKSAGEVVSNLVRKALAPGEMVQDRKSVV